MQLIALIWGILAMVGFSIAFLPCFGSFNYLNIPFAIVGVIVAAVAMSNSRPGQRGTAVAGLVLNVIAIVLGALRLIAGGFVL